MALTQISTQGIKDGTITGTDLATNVDLVDNQKLRLGTGNDLELYHDSSHSIINDSFGSLLVRSDIVQISTPAGSKYFKGQSGVAELYHSDSKKFETASHGVEVIGKLTFAGDGHTQGIELGADADIVFYHDNSDGYLDNNVGDLYLRNDGNSTSEKVRIQAKGGEQSIICSPNGTVELYYDNSKKLETSSSGVSVTGTLNLGSGDLTLTGNINISDSSGGGNNRLIFGVSDDLQIWHDGSDSYIADEGTGALKILSNLFRVNNAANDEAMIKAE